MTAGINRSATVTGPASGRGRILRDVTAEAWTNTRMGVFAGYAAARHRREFPTYEALWSWSVHEPDQFWSAIVEFFDLGITGLSDNVVTGSMPDVTWLPDAALNYARDALRRQGPQAAVIGLSQTRAEVILSWDELRQRVAACRAGLQRLGVRKGDAVAAYMPNVPETVVLLLAAASLGAVFASCPPEFGVRAVVDRFGQLEPKVLVASDGYVYGERVVDRSGVIAQLVDALPGLGTVVIHEYVGVPSGISNVLTWEQLLGTRGEIAFDDVPFDHPLYVLFSSGSTGRPKAIVHSHGGILLEHAKALGLHNDVRTGDRFFWFSTTGWMVWNYAVSALVHGAAMVCYDGNPNHPDPMELWRAVDRTRVTFFGTSAAHIMMSAARSLDPAAELSLGSLRAVASTGSPLPAEGFEWLDDHVSRTAHISSVSGGTDVCSGFVGGSPLVPTRAGELSAPMLGCRAVSLAENGDELTGEFGELCITAPMPSMPLRLLGDDGGTLLRESYFSTFPTVWAQGDWVKFFPDRACVIVGRSDTTLNRGGVRLGTADIYGVVDAMPGIDDSLVVHLEDARGGAGTLVLLLAGTAIGEGDRSAAGASVVSEIRQQLSPRHVPDVVAWVRGIPRTLTGKKLEKPVKRLLLGARPEDVASVDSLTSPAHFDALVAWAREFRSSR